MPQFGVKWSFPCVLPDQLGIYSWEGATMPMGYKTWANPDIDLPLLAKHLVGLSKGPSHPGDNKPTRHRSLSPSPPSRHANKSQSGKGHRFLVFLPRICAWLLPPPHLLLPALPLLPMHVLLGR